MAERSVIQWDKDDLDALGLMKVDVLALGMLTAIRRALDGHRQRRGRPFRMQDIPREDPATYEMIGRADTVGVFQIESRAQMAMLPRLKPRCFYDLVIEVAIVRPGPIQGDMVHPYLRRRRAGAGGDPSRLPVEAVLGAHAGRADLPGAGDADLPSSPPASRPARPTSCAARWPPGGARAASHLLRAAASTAWPSAATRGVRRGIFRQIQGFGEYGFPESHAASFALLVYVSAWLKRHEPAAFLAAACSTQQPMGFYSRPQLVQDARRHGVEVRAQSAQQLDAAADGSPAWACGIVTMRQQPETAKGTIFVTLEDETGSVNVIVWRHVRERQRPALMRSRLLAVAGTWQRQDGVTHLVARRLVDMTPWLGAVATASRDFH
jgi:error-prone DNA polymerase